MLKLDDFKVKEIETLETTTGGGYEPVQQCLDLTHKHVRFLGWIIRTDTIGDIHDDN